MLQRIIGAVLLLAILAAGVVMYQRRTLDAKNPLASELIELERVKIERLTEQEKQKTEQERRETARTLARIERQAKLESNQGVSFAAVTLAMFWRLFPVLTFGATLTGGIVYAFTRRVSLTTPQISGAFPRKDALVIAQTALTVSNSEAMGKALAFQHDISQQQIHSAVEIFRSLKPGRETFNISNQSALPAASEQPQRAENVPTFQEILANLDEGDQMIFGYDTTTGEPITGDFSRLYSSFIGGRSGSGKTSALRGLILQSLKTTPDIEYLIHDPHAEHRESLAQTLPKCRQIRFTGANPLPDVRRFAEALQERIDTNTTDAPPLVFVVDELAYCSKQRYFPNFQAMFDRISTEGRKVRVYLLASSQDLRFRKTGDFRDTLASSFLFNLKSGQVKAFTQDTELTKLHRQVRVANAPGLALLDLTDGDPVIIKTPFCSPNDARFLPLHNLPAGRGEDIQIDLKKGTRDEENASQDVLGGQGSNVIPFPKRDTSTQATQPQTTLTQSNTTDNTGDTTDTTLLTAALGLCGNDKKVLADRSGVSVSLIKEIQAGRRRITDDTRQKFARVLEDTQQEA